MSEVVAKYAFVVIPIGLSMAGAVLAGPGPGVVIAAASGLVELTRFWKFDHKPVIADGDLDAAAMVHDARKGVVFGLIAKEKEEGLIRHYQPPAQFGVRFGVKTRRF